jgi:cobalt/nickel transport system ATP-binding protein
LQYSYGRRTVFSGVSLEVSEGEAVGLAGPNGAGKTTLLWCLLGLLKPAHGEVQRRGRCGVVFQNPEDQLFMPSLEEDLALPLWNRGVAPQEARRAAVSALEQVGLLEYCHAPAAALSLGQRKRAAIAAALVQKPDLLVLDEPTSELDARSVRQVAGLLRSLDCAKLISSHNLAFLAEVSERLLILDQGCIAAQGPSAELGSDAALLARHGLA